MNKAYKPFVLLAVAGSFLSLLFWGIWIFVNEGAGVLAAGVVSEVATSSVVITDKQQEQMTVFVSTSTTIRRGREEVAFNEITPDSFVQVNGTTISEISIAADSIRLMRGPYGKKARHED